MTDTARLAYREYFQKKITKEELKEKLQGTVQPTTYKEVYVPPPADDRYICNTCSEWFNSKNPYRFSQGIHCKKCEKKIKKIVSEART